MDDEAALAHIDRFNAAVVSGDWAAFVATFHPDAVMAFDVPGVGPFAGREAIAAAYAADPPGGTMRVVRVDGDHVAFAWSAGGTGTMEIRWVDGLVSRLAVRFD